MRGDRAQTGGAARRAHPRTRLPRGLAALTVICAVNAGQADAQSASSFWRTSLADPAGGAVAAASPSAEARVANGGVTAVPLARPAADPPLVPPLPPTAQTPAAPTGPAGPAVRSAVDPYAPLGLRLGSLTVLPRASLFGTADLDDGSTGAVVSGEVDIQSDWSRHSLNVSARALRALEDDGAYEIEGLARGTVDMGSSRVGSDTRLTLTAGARDTRDTPLADTALPSDTDLIAPTGGGVGVGNILTPNDARVLVGSVTLAHDLGRLALEAGVSGERADAGRRDSYTTLAGRVRAGYALAGATPFVEGVVSTTDFDDNNDTEALGLLVGLDFGQNGRLRGSVAGGLERVETADPACDCERAETGIVWRGAVAYDVTPLVTVDLAAETERGATTDRTDSISFGLTHAVRRWLTLQAGLDTSWARPDEAPSSTTVAGSLGATYALGRHARLSATYTHTRVETEAADTSDNALRLGLTVQR